VQIQSRNDLKELQQNSKLTRYQYAQWFDHLYSPTLGLGHDCYLNPIRPNHIIELNIIFVNCLSVTTQSCSIILIVCVWFRLVITIRVWSAI
jgi:hypothetical protein